MAKWLEDEIQIIRDNWDNLNDFELHELIPNHSKFSIETKRKDIGLIRNRHRKYTYQDVIDEFRKRDGYILLSTENEFENCNSKMRYICKNHQDKGEQAITLNHLMTGRGCYYCGRETTAIAKMVKFDKKYDYELCIKNDFTYIDTKRIDGIIYIEFICNKHNELGNQIMRKNNMKRNIHGCQYCSGKNIPDWYIMDKIKDTNPNIIRLEPYINMTTSMSCYCNIHKTHTMKTIQQILNGQGCYYCGLEKLSSQMRLTIEESQIHVNKINPHIKILKYNGAKGKSECLCSKHGYVFYKFHQSLICGKSGCTKCYEENIRNQRSMGIEIFKERLNYIHPELVVLGKYVNNNTPIEVYCSNHDYYYLSTPSSLLTRSSCCDKSRVTYKEEQVCRLIEKWGYKITRQYTFDKCIDIRKLPFDIYLNDFNTVIEYQGEQHYRPVRYSSETNEQAMDKFNYTRRHDSIKKEFCKNNNIKLIEIPYWEFDDLEYFLFDKFSKLGIIQEIKGVA